MLKISALTTSILLLFVFTALTAANQPQKVTVRVDGLACPFCAYGLEKKLKKIESVEKLEIKINEGVVTLYFKQGAKIDKEQIAKKVKEAGFTPRELKIESESKQVAGQPDAIKGQKISLNIKGMSCEGCVSRVKTTLSNLDCVKDVDVELSAERPRLPVPMKKLTRLNLCKRSRNLALKRTFLIKKVSRI